MNRTSSPGSDPQASGPEPQAKSHDTTAAQTSPHWQSWVTADNAAGFVLRYLQPMREQLIQWLGNAELADQSLKLLIAHLVSHGFGSHAKGRMRDFLLRAIRAAAKTALAEAAKPPPVQSQGQPAVVFQNPPAPQPAVDFAAWTVDAASWRGHWRGAVLARCWRALERIEHKDASQPLYSLLRAAMSHPRETAEMLAIRINTQSDLVVDAAAIGELLPQARQTFAQLLLTEVQETLDQGDAEAVQAELQALGLADWLRQLRGDD